MSDDPRATKGRLEPGAPKKTRKKPAAKKRPARKKSPKRAAKKATKKTSKRAASKRKRTRSARKAPKRSRAAKPIERPLTGKQAAFVRWYTTPGETLFNGTKAAAAAGYTGGDNAIAVMAYENLRKPHIAKAIQLSIRKAYSAADLTIEKVLRDIELVRLLAVSEGRYSAALRASDMHGKYLKMWVQKIEHLHTIEDATTEELLILLRQILGNIDGLDLADLVGGDGPAPGGLSHREGATTTH